MIWLKIFIETAQIRYGWRFIASNMLKYGTNKDLFIYLFIHSFIYLFIYLFIHSFIYLFIYLFIHLKCCNPVELVI